MALPSIINEMWDSSLNTRYGFASLNRLIIRHGGLHQNAGHDIGILAITDSNWCRNNARKGTVRSVNSLTNDAHSTQRCKD